MSKAARNRLSICVAVWLATCSALLGNEGPIVAIDELLGRDLALLKQADEQLRNGSTGEALDILLPLLEQQGEKFVAAHEATETYQFTLYVTLREAVVRRLAKHKGAVAEFRERSGSRFRTGISSPGRVDLSVMNSGGSNAWLERADQLTRLGKYNNARDYLYGLRALNVGFDLGSSEEKLRHDQRESEALARLAYISYLEGSPARLKQERNEFARQFSTASIRIAGREEAALKRIDQWIDELGTSRASNKKLSDTQLEFGIDPHEDPIWRRDRETIEEKSNPGAIAAFPTGSGSSLFISTGDAAYLLPIDARMAQQGAWPAPLYRATTKSDRGLAPLETPRAISHQSEGFVYARLGSTVTRKRTAVPWGDHAPAVLAAFDASRGGRLLSGFPLSPGLEEEFDGPPLVRDGRLYVAIRKRDEVRTQAIVRCVDVANLKVVWDRTLCNAETRGRGTRDEANQTAIFVDGDRLYVVPQMGCVACLDAPSGAIRWLMRYPRPSFTSDSPNRARWNRGLGGIHLRSNLLVVLAADCERVFALDSLSGEFRWCSRREVMADAQYVLGSTEDQILLMGESVYWLDAATGQVKACYPERWANVAPGQVDLQAAPGRGIWAGEAVWYPTKDGVLKLTMNAAGQVVVTSVLKLPEHSEAVGNLAYHDGQLLWASGDCVIAWKAPREAKSPKKPTEASK